MRRLLGTLLALALFAPAAASGAQAMPWTYVMGEVNVLHNKTFALEMQNLSGTPQTIETAGIYPGGSASRTVGSSSSVFVGGVCDLSGGCQEFPLIQTSSPEVFPSIFATVDLDGNEAPMYIGPGQFALMGPNGVANEALDSLSAANTTAFGSLTGATSSLQGTLGSASSQLGGVAGTASTIQSTTAASDFRLAALQGQVKTLTSDVTSLTKLVKKLEPKPKPKKHKSTHH